MMLNCGHYSSVWADMTGLMPGYGYFEGYTLCYGCMYVDQAVSMRWETTFFAYQAGNRITDWVGNRLGDVLRSKVNKAGFAPQLMVWVVDLHGQHWYGTGPTESGTYVRLRKIKVSS